MSKPIKSRWKIGPDRVKKTNQPLQKLQPQKPLTLAGHHQRTKKRLAEKGYTMRKKGLKKKYPPEHNKLKHG